MKITKAQLNKMTVKELNEMLNDTVKYVKYTSVERRDVRGEMFNAIKEKFSDNIKMDITHSDNSKAYIVINDRFGVSFNLSVTSTGKTEKITRLKSKDIVGSGKIKITSVYSSYSVPCYSFDDSEKLSLKLDGFTNGGDLDLKKKKNITFKEMSSPETYISEVYKQVEPEEKLRARLLTHISQSLILKVSLGINNGLPDMFENLKQKDDNWFEICEQEILKANPNLIDTILENISIGKR